MKGPLLILVCGLVYAQGLPNLAALNPVPQALSKLVPQPAKGHDTKLERLVKQNLENQRIIQRHNDPVPIMVAKEGYPIETHTVITDDGYVLEMHRIPHGKNSERDPLTPRPVVYLQHGLLCSSADWVMGSPEKSLGYILADAGYDVWLGNYRGNTYSRNHLTLRPSDKEFWQFSWDQMGDLDIPAMIDKVLEVSGQEQLFYIGHSMGTTGFMVMANKHPEYQDKVILASLLAPVAYVDHMSSPIRLLAPYVNQVEWLLNFLGLGEFLPSNWLIDWLASFACTEDGVPGICQSILFVLCGFDEAQLNKTLLETIIAHTPAGASSRTVIHYAQEVNSKVFQAYDHGDENNDYYGQPTPPLYSIDAVTAPIAAYWSLNDWLANPVDVQRFTSVVPNLVSNYLVPFDLWNHLDYLWGIDADTLLYPEILSNMEAFLVTRDK